MKAYKEGRFLVFDLEDGRNVKYDLSSGQCIGFSGKVVKDVKNQLQGYNIYEVINSFEDKAYVNFLNKVYQNLDYGVCNIGTFLLKVRKHRKLEQYFTSGLKHVSINLAYEYNDVPKSLINICKEREIMLDNILVRQYKKHMDLLFTLKDIKFKHLKYDRIIDLFSSEYSSGYKAFISLTKKYNYDSLTLFKYLDELMYYEGINNLNSLLTELNDYAKMSDAITTKKFNKYPRNFLTTHVITVRNYNRLSKWYSEEDFAKRIDLSLEKTINDYAIVYPKTVQDIKDEAISLNHCVASYIQEVIDGECHILFLRRKDKLDESLITLQVIDGQIVHVAGNFNREPSKEEKAIIDLYNAKNVK